MDHTEVYEIAGYPGDETPYLGDEYVGDDYFGDEYVGDDYDDIGAMPIQRRFRGRYPRHVGRFQRGAYNRQMALRAQNSARRAANQAKQHARALAAQRAAGEGRPVKMVVDDIFIITATSASAGTVSKTVAAAEEYYVQKVMFDGSNNGAEITSLGIGKTTVLGPFAGDDALPASAFTAQSQQALLLKGAHIRRSDAVTLTGTIASDGDKLKAVLFVKRVVDGPAGC